MTTHYDGDEKAKQKDQIAHRDREPQVALYIAFKAQHTSSLPLSPSVYSSSAYHMLRAILQSKAVFSAISSLQSGGGDGEH